MWGESVGILLPVLCNVGAGPACTLEQREQSHTCIDLHSETSKLRAVMVRWGSKKLAHRFLPIWLLILVPIKPFYLEPPYVTTQPKGDLASEHHHPGASSFIIENHVNVTLAHVEVTCWLNPTVILAMFAEIVIVAMIMHVVIFWCHLKVPWTISGRVIIQVLVSGHGRTEVVNVCSHSPGKTLYQVIEEKNGIQVHLETLMHGVKIIRHSLSLQEQGICHLSTVFVLPVMVKGGVRIRLDKTPTLPQLIGFQYKDKTIINIPEAIGGSGRYVGTILLNDESGVIIDDLEKHHDSFADINFHILKRWRKGGSGITDTSWRRLISVLEWNCRTLAEKIAAAFIFEDTDQMSTVEVYTEEDAEPEAVCLFKEHLKSYYSQRRYPMAMWPPLHPEKFINLAIVNRNKIDKKFEHGNVDKIRDIAPVELEELLGTEPKQNILVEGVPGVGKTTLSWEICKRWAKRELFMVYSLILLLQLREKTVQDAKTIEDLLLHLYKEQLEAIAKYIRNARGNNMLIILEAFDELPQRIPPGSICDSLLAGRELPDVTIIVTSRPSAQLSHDWKFRFTRHVEILGFTEDNITAYVASILNSECIPVSEFNTYFSRTPRIRQVMYIPLYSGIVVEIYKALRNSDTPRPSEAKLYTELVITILRRYLSAHPDYKDDHNIDIKDFTDLPKNVYRDLKKLTKLAYDGIVNQKPVLKDEVKPIEHLGLMDVVAECPRIKLNPKYSYEFLHLSIQEYLGATYASQIDTNTQEQLLKNICTKPHIKNMAMFLAAIREEKRRGAHKVCMIFGTRKACMHYFFCLFFSILFLLIFIYVIIYDMFLCV